VVAGGLLRRDGIIPAAPLLRAAVAAGRGRDSQRRASAMRRYRFRARFGEPSGADSRCSRLI